MTNFITGFIFGFFVATIGFTGIAQALDTGIEKVKNVSVKIDTGK